MIEQMIEILQNNLGDRILEIEYSGHEVYIRTGPDDAWHVCNFIYREIDCSLLSLFASDERPVSGVYKLFYAFSVRKAGMILVVHTELTEDSMKIRSLCPGMPGAALYEREIRDMYGIEFKGHPDPREWVHHGNWPEGLHPLRKDFPAYYKPEFTDREQEFLRIQGTGVYEIPVGPVHAGIIEPGHFRFSVAGEPIINLEAKLYYVHKGMEKLAENQHFEKNFYLAERISGDETVSNSLAYCQAIEIIAGLEELPERASYTRSILNEMERIYNHLGDLAGICIDVAYSFAAYQFNMMRRWCMIHNEEITGSRMLRSSIQPGGVRRDFIRGNEDRILNHLAMLEKEFDETVKIIKANSLFIDRVENTGVIPHQVAIDLNAVGPAGRSAGVDADVRRDFPYAAYGRLGVKVPLHRNGDVNCRMNVKIEEMHESIRLIRKALEDMPSTGAIRKPVVSLPPYRWAFGLTESARGENCHFVMSGEENTIFRYKIRTPSFCNWPVLCHAVKGNIVPDFPLINKSFNLSYSGNDL